MAPPLSAVESLFPQRLHDATTHLVAIKDEHGIYRAANEAFCRLLGRERSEVVGRRDDDLFGHAQVARMRSADETARGGACVRLELFDTGRARRRLLVTRIPVTAEQTDKTWMLFSAVELHQLPPRKCRTPDLRQADRARRRVTQPHTRDRSPTSILRAALDVVPFGLIVTDADGTIVEMNAKALAMAGCDSLEQAREQQASSGLFELVAGPQADPLQRVLAGESLAQLHLQVRQRLSEKLWTASFSGAPVRDASGALSMAVLTVADVTERLDAEQQAGACESPSHRAQKNESLALLAGGIAHDFNNLLVGVIGNADLALLDLPDDSPVRALLESIKTAGFRASELTAQMLAFSGKGRFVLEPLQLNALIRSTLTKLGTVPSELTIHLGRDLPPVEADARQVERLVRNLLANAVEAAGDDGHVRIETEARYCDRKMVSSAIVGEQVPEGRYAILRVTDDGPGIDETIRARIFEPFFSTKFPGRGLGLPAVMGIVQAHHGAIRVESKPGATTFEVLLPARSAAARIESADATGEAGPAPLVLVVDTEGLVRTVARALLEHAGLRVLTASSGDEALQAVRTHAGEIKLVLLDVTMPDKSGKQTLRETRQLDQHVPVLLASGFDRQQATASFEGLGLAGFIQKPFDGDTLLKQVRAVLQSQARRDGH